jgi:hypothetical protein
LAFMVCWLYDRIGRFNTSILADRLRSEECMEEKGTL